MNRFVYNIDFINFMKDFIMKNIMLAYALASSSAFAQTDEIIKIETPCYATEKFIKEITDKHKEAPVLMGKSVKETNTVIWINPTTKDYTITTTIPAAGLTCVLDSGKSFGEFGKKSPAKKTVNL